MGKIAADISWCDVDSGTKLWALSTFIHICPLVIHRKDKMTKAIDEDAIPMRHGRRIRVRRYACDMADTREEGERNHE